MSPSGVQVLNYFKMLQLQDFVVCRLFLTMAPAHGELSRAMRNRGVEVFMLADVSSGVKC